MNDWKEELRRADVDVDGAIRRFVNKEDRYIKYLKLFIKNPDLHNLIVAIDRKDVTAAFDICHTLKGVSGNLGFNKIFSHTSEACEMLRSGSLDGVEELVVAVKPNYEEIVRIIETYLE